MKVGTRFNVYGFITSETNDAVGIATDYVKTDGGSHKISEREVRTFGPWKKWANVAKQWSLEMNRLEMARMIEVGDMERMPS